MLFLQRNMTAKKTPKAVVRWLYKQQDALSDETPEDFYGR